jgi:hypothetical protein
VSAPPSRRLPTVRLLAAALVLLVATTGGWAAGRADAQTAGSGEPITLTLRRQTNWVGPEAVFQVAFSATSLPAGATVGGELHQKVTSRATLEAVANGQTPGSTIFKVTPQAAAALTGADGALVVSLPVTTGSPSSSGVAQLATPGVYPFAVQVFDANGKVVASLTTTLLRLGAPDDVAASNTLAVGLVVPVQADAVPGPDGAPTLDEAGAEHLTTTIDLTVLRTSVPLTLSPSPESLELLRSRDAAGEATVAQVRAGPTRTVLTNPYAPVDSGDWIDSGLVDELGDQYTAGTTTLLGLLRAPPEARLAVLDRTVSPAALDDLRARGVEAVAVPSGQLSPLSNATTTATFASQFEVVTAGGPALRAVVADDATATRLTQGLDPVLAGHRALAELAYLHLAGDTTSRGVAVSVPAQTSAAALATFLDGLADTTGTNGADGVAPGAPMVSPVTLGDLFQVTATATGSRTTPLVRSYQADQPADLGSYPADLRGAHVALDGLRSLVPGAGEVTQPIARTIWSSGARSLDADGRDAMIGSAERSITAVTDEIVVAPEQVVTLTSSSGEVPLNLENRLPYDATVRIVLTSAKLDFPEGSVIERTIPAAQTTTIKLPVEIRASGAFPLTVDITSADGQLPVATTTYTVRSTAISGIGLILSVGAGLFLLVWWARHFRTSRRARKLVASNHPALSGGGPDGYAPPDSDPRPAPAIPSPPDPDPLEGR